MNRQAVQLFFKVHLPGLRGSFDPAIGREGYGTGLVRFPIQAQPFQQVLGLGNSFRCPLCSEAALFRNSIAGPVTAIFILPVIVSMPANTEAEQITGAQPAFRAAEGRARLTLCIPETSVIFPFFFPDVCPFVLCTPVEGFIQHGFNIDFRLSHFPHDHTFAGCIRFFR